MKRYFYFLISIICYLVGTGGLFYFLAWLGDLAPFSDINRAVTMNPILAVIKNLGLISIFGLQHSIMARKSFKKSWIKIIPKPIERSVYVLISGLLCLLIAWQWEPLGGWLWQFAPATIANVIFMTIFTSGIVFLLASSFLINHFELFGLQQSYLHLTDKKNGPPRFTDFAFYRLTRHPIYLGLFLTLWSTPEMSMTRFMLALCITMYIYVGIYFEEKDLVSEYGEQYRMYRQQVPKLIPGTARSPRHQTSSRGV